MSEALQIILAVLLSILESILKIIEIAFNAIGITDTTTICILTIAILIIAAVKRPRRSRRR